MQKRRVGGRQGLGRSSAQILIATWPPATLRAHYGALRPPVRLEACLPRPSVACIEAALSVEARSPRGFGAGGLYLMDLGGETGVGESWGASTAVSRQSMGRYIEAPAGVKDKRLVKHISLVERCKFLLGHPLFCWNSSWLLRIIANVPKRL
eukprot:209647-Chlamydomonas_euryale.AAC.1